MQRPRCSIKPPKTLGSSLPTVRSGSTLILATLYSSPMSERSLVVSPAPHEARHRLRARAFGTYPRPLAASRMRYLVSGEAEPLPLSTLPTVWKLTPAFEATSRRDTCVSGSPLRNWAGPAMTGPAALIPWLAFQARVGDTLNDLALEEQEHDYQGQPGEHGGGHDVGVADAVGALHRGDADRDGHHVRVSHDDEGPEKVVPGEHEDKDRHRRDRGPGEGHPDLPVDP